MQSKWNCACGNAKLSKACGKQPAGFLRNETYLSQGLAVPGPRRPLEKLKPENAGTQAQSHLVHESPEPEATYLSIHR